jgi:glycosyltransferase involved in cell wall biosynthesis
MILTIFTATYNRAYTLERVYNSLINQKNYKFEWLIVDDGSIDETKTIIENFKNNDPPFEINYIYKLNGGKHSTYEYCSKYAKGEYYISLDSDDELTPNTVEIAYKYINEIKIRKLDYVAGIVGNVIDHEENMIGRCLQENLTPLDYGLFLLEKNFGDKFEILRTKLLKEFKFPEANNEKYVPESCYLHQIAKKYKIITISHVGTRKWIDKRNDHLNDRYEKNFNREGRRLAYKFILINSYRLVTPYPILMIKIITEYIITSIELKILLIEQFKEIENKYSRILWMLAVPISLVRFIIEKYKK